MFLLMEMTQDLSQMRSDSSENGSQEEEIVPYEGVPKLKDPHPVARSAIVIIRSGVGECTEENGDAFMSHADFEEEKKERKMLHY